MSILYERIAQECEKMGITGYRLCKDCNVSPSIITDLKMGRKTTLSADNADKFAKRLCVSVGYLIGNDNERTDPLQALRDDERALLQTYRTATENEKQMMRIFAKGLKNG